MTSLTAHIATPFRADTVQVTLPPDPWGLTTQAPDPRPETAPRRGVVSHQHRMTPQQVIDTIRREWIRTRAGA